MTYLRFNKIILHNIRCFTDMKIEFSKGTNVITGENGSGKSTLLLSIGFALFGTKYLNATGIDKNDLIKWGEIEGSIDLDFSCVSGNYTSIYKLSKKGGSWVLKENKTGKLISKTISETRKMIQQLLGNLVDENVFKNALSSAQGELTILLDAKPADRKIQLNKILGLTEYDNSSKFLNKIVNKLENKRKEYQNDIKIREESYRDPDIVKKQLLDFETEEKNIKSNINELNKKLSTSNDTMKKLVSRKDKLLELKSYLKNKNEEYEKNKSKQNEVSKKLNQGFKELKLKFSKEEELDKYRFEIREKDNKNSSELRKIEEIITKYNSYKKQYKDYSDRNANYKEELKKVNKKLVELLNIDSLENLIEIKEHDQMELKNIEDKKQQLSGNKEELERKSSKLKNINSELKQISDDFTNTVKLKFNTTANMLENILLDYNSKISIAEKEENLLQKTIKELDIKLGQLDANRQLSLETIELLTKIGETANCPTCFRVFSSDDKISLIPKHKEKLNEINSQINESNRELGTINDKKEKIISEVKNMNKSIKEIEKLINRIPEINRIRNTISDNEKELNDLALSIEKVNLELTKISKVKIEQLKSKIDKTNGLINSINNLTNNKNIIQAKLDNNKENLYKLSKEQDKLDIEVNMKIRDELSVEKSEIEKELSILEKKILPNFKLNRTLTINEITLGDEILECKSEISELENTYNEKELVEIEANINDYRTKLGENKSRLNTLSTSLIPETREKIEFLEKQSIKLENTRESLNRLETALPTTRKVNTVLSSLPSTIMSRITDVVSHQITQTMRRLLPNRGFDKVIFKEDGDIHLTYNGMLVDRKSISGGEKTVIGVALRLALAEYVAPMKFMILDEPTNHLDTARINEFIEIVDRDDLFSGKNGQLLIVTHREEFNRNANKTIKISVDSDLKRTISINDID